jgi:hypothetical protein
MRAAPLAAALAIAVACSAAAAGCADSGDTFVDCSSRQTWNGAEYTDDGLVRGLPPTGAALRPAAVRQTCERETLTAHRIAGVDPALAVRAGDDAGAALWLAVGFYPQLPIHPLHRALYGAGDRPFRAGDFGRCTFRGTISAVARDLEVRRDATTARVIIDAGTTITGAPTVAGQPRMSTGANVTIQGRRCAPIHDPGLPGGEWRKLTAVRIRFA